MAYRGYFMFGEMELARTTRVIDHIRELSSADNAVLEAQLPGPCRPFEVTYDDSWSEEREHTGNNLPFTIEDAPWVRGTTNPVAREFLGIWVMDVEGLDTSTLSTTVNESLGDGGTSGHPRAAVRVANFTALVVALTDAGAQYGMRWLDAVLSRQRDEAYSAGLSFFEASPEASGGDPVTLTAFLPTVTSMPTVVDVAGLGGGKQHRQSTIRRVEFSISFRDPALYEEVSAQNLTLTPDVGPVQWVTDGEGCFDDESCREHFVYPASCATNVPTPVNASPVMPTCAGCLKLCDLDTRTASITIPTEPMFSEYAIGLTVINTSAVEQSATLHLQRVYTTSPAPDSPVMCQRFGRAALNGFSPGMAAMVSPAYRGIMASMGGVTSRSIGHITAPTGAPYRLPVVQSHENIIDGVTLVMECEPDDQWIVLARVLRKVA